MTLRDSWRSSIVQSAWLYLEVITFDKTRLVDESIKVNVSEQSLETTESIPLAKTHGLLSRLPILILPPYVHSLHCTILTSRQPDHHDFTQAVAEHQAMALH